MSPSRTATLLRCQRRRGRATRNPSAGAAAAADGEGFAKCPLVSELDERTVAVPGEILLVIDRSGFFMITHFSAYQPLSLIRPITGLAVRSTTKSYRSIAESPESRTASCPTWSSSAAAAGGTAPHPPGTAAAATATAATGATAAAAGPSHSRQRPRGRARGSSPTGQGERYSTGGKLFIGSKVLCLFAFEICTPEEEGEKGEGMQISRQSTQTQESSLAL